LQKSIDCHQKIFSDLQMFERPFDAETRLLKIVITDILVKIFSCLAIAVYAVKSTGATRRSVSI